MTIMELFYKVREEVSYRIAGNFRGRKLSRIGEKYDFRGENFRGLLACVALKDAAPPNFAEKTFANSHKTVKFAKVFFLESFPLYGIYAKEKRIGRTSAIHTTKALPQLSYKGQSWKRKIRREREWKI